MSKIMITITIMSKIMITSTIMIMMLTHFLAVKRF
jgi:hypothetical protein